jgi:beta-glucosidase
VTNTGKVAGADVPQLYLTQAPDEKRARLLGFERVELAPGESSQVTLTADPRLLALGKSAGDPVLSGSVGLQGRLFGK